ncbi:protein spaetzle 5 [Diorhabda sublineata]|uniref:protein spaetzle 5 n=1 Tax=Diorhabda sublineata TaxID=1163346 RepID=UPI0024E0F9AE|nr:protein spaetzle 5 [Diorhabda sublineata]
MRFKTEFKAIIWFSNLVILCQSVCSPLYGAEPCKFLPAPPGKTPQCARPGLTYCEYPDHYPGELINYLVKKWRYDHSTLFTSESQEDFSSYFYPTVSPVYGPPNYQPPNIGHNPGGYPEPIHIPKPQVPFQDNGVSYNIQPNVYVNQNFTGYPDYNEGYKYNTPNKPTYYQPYQQALEPSQYGQYNNLWKRALQQNHRRFKRSLKMIRMPVIERYSNKTSTNFHRKKRQSLPGRQQTLCQVRTQYITPRAALNNKGNWMYVVNMAEVDNRVTQLVKSETCVSQTCDGICSLPDGYTSRCEQKYVQKRLVALEGAGNQLYTDVFWFPSCCVCTISNN